MSSPRPSGQRQKQTPATIKDVARHAGVSIATVSRVLNRVATVDAALADRVRVACAALRIDPQLERHGSFSADSGRRLAGELLDLAPPVEALFAGNNRITQGALEALHARNLHVPDDIAVVGFDEVPWAIPGTLSLTAVTQPAYELGSTAALRLLQRLQHPGQVVRQEIVLAHQLHIGDSSRPREHSSATRAR